MKVNKSTLFAVRYRLIITFFIVTMTAFLAIGLRWLRVEPDLSSVLPQSEGEKTQSIYTKSIEEQDSHKSIFVIFEPLNNLDFFTPTVLNALSNFHNELLFHMGIPRASILDIINTFNDFENIRFHEKESQEFKKQVLEAPFISDMFLSQDKRATIISVIYKSDDYYPKSHLYGYNLPVTIERLVEQYRGKYPFLKLGISGTAMVEENIISYMNKDLRFLFPMTITLIFVLLLFLIRSFTAAILPLLVAFVSVVWTLGLKGWIGSQLSLVEAILPILLISVACADGVHIMNEVIEHLRHKNPLNACVTLTMRRLRVPIILTSLTTGLGFLSLLSASGQAFRNLGIFMTFGVGVSMAFSLWGVPAVLSYLPLKPTKTDSSPMQSSYMAEKFVRFTSRAFQHKKLLCSLILFIFGLSIYSLWTININFDEVAFLKKSTQVRQMADAIQENFGGYGIITLTLNKKDGSSFRQLKDLQNLSTLEESIKREVPNISFVNSVNFIIKGMNYKLRSQDPAEYKIVENPIILRQLLNLIDRTPALANSLPGFVSNEWKTAYINLRVRQLGTISLKKTAEVLEPLLAKIVPDNYIYTLGGDYKRLRLSQVILKEQITSLISSLITILLVMLLIFRSISNGLVVVFPIVWATFFNFLFMKLFCIPLNPGTATVASIGMGVGVDYSIHYFSAFRRIYFQKKDYRGSILQAIRETVQGIGFNAIAVSVGFTVLLFSAYEIVMLMSVIVILTMLTTAVSSLTILPILLDTFKPKLKKGLYLEKLTLSEDDKGSLTQTTPPI